MKILVAPDSFKGSLTAAEAAAAIGRGVLVAEPGAEVDLCPLSDGGEGIAQILQAASGGTTHALWVTGPVGARVHAEWLMLPDGTAIIEVARAIGLGLVPEAQRAPTRTTSYGVGELILDAIAKKATKIVVGLGGTATTDGGAGAAQALGARFHGSPTPIVARELRDVRAVSLPERDTRRLAVDLVCATDVDSPLLGPDGAARAFGPQKGATGADVDELEAALAHLTTLTRDPGTVAGDGAAGGLAYGLRLFAGARRERGIDVVFDRTAFDRRLAGCDLVLTGEGRLDGQSARGKVVSGVTRRCSARGVRVVALVGSVGPGADALSAEGLSAYFSILDDTPDVQRAMTDAAALLETMTTKVVKSIATQDASSRAHHR